jgi:transcriptional regulator with XRE-family HTH domain
MSRRKKEPVAEMASHGPYDEKSIGLLLEHLGSSFRKARTKRGITQEQLAESTGLNIRTIQRIEAGQTNILITTALKLILAIGCGPDEIPPPSEVLRNRSF